MSSGEDCHQLPAWPAHEVRFTRAVCLPDAAYDRSMTPDGPREIVIDHDDLGRVGERIGQKICSTSAPPGLGRISWSCARTPLRMGSGSSHRRPGMRHVATVTW